MSLQYRICGAEDASTLEGLVQAAIADGFRPIGGVAVSAVFESHTDERKGYTESFTSCREGRRVPALAWIHGHRAMTARRRWSPEHEALLRHMYPDAPMPTMVDALDRTAAQIYRKAADLGLHRSEAYLASPLACRLRRENHPGVATQFKKGQVSHNKGLRRPGWFRGRMKETQFKKGRLAHEARNYVPIGTTKLSKDGYLERKVTDDPTLFPARRWVGVHRLVWEAANGPVPPGHAVAFLPGRRTADESLITLDALELVSRAELMRRNTYHRYPKEIALAIQLRGALVRKINRKVKELEEQN
jgi:hypothetical protein